jgi:hypothetical protein
VWVVRGGKLEGVPVRIGIKGRERVEAAAGLNENDLVVAEPAKGMQSGQAVRAQLAGGAPAREGKR